MWAPMLWLWQQPKHPNSFEQTLKKLCPQRQRLNKTAIKREEVPYMVHPITQKKNKLALTNRL